MHNDTSLIEECIKKEAKASQENFAKTVAEEASQSVVVEVTKVVNQLDNKTSLNQMKNKLETIKQNLETIKQNIGAFDVESINEINKSIKSGNELITNVNSKIENQVNTVRTIGDTVSQINSLLSEIKEKKGADFFEKLINSAESSENKIDTLLSNKDTIEKISIKVHQIYDLMTSLNIQEQLNCIKPLLEASGQTGQKLSEISTILSGINQSTAEISGIKEVLDTVTTSIDEFTSKNNTDKICEKIDRLDTHLKYLILLNGFAVAGIIGMAIMLFIN